MKTLLLPNFKFLFDELFYCVNIGVLKKNIIDLIYCISYLKFSVFVIFQKEIEVVKMATSLIISINYNNDVKLTYWCAIIKKIRENSCFK